MSDEQFYVTNATLERARAAARREALEEAAKIAEAERFHDEDMIYREAPVNQVCDTIAYNIRALLSQNTVGTKEETK